jgi:membrane protease subunit HflC
MNGATIRAGLLVVIAIIVAVLTFSIYIVQQTQHALVLRFGAVRTVVSEPGLYFKLPFFENVLTFDKRILDLDLPAQEVIASDQKRLVVDSFTRYRINDPLRFYQTLNNVFGANSQLSTIVNSTVRTVLAEASFSAVVRTDRQNLMNRIRDEVNKVAQTFGITVVDVRIRRADLPEQNSQAVFQRMQTERQREAADIRAQGSQLAQSIRARADRDVTVLLAEANRTAEETRGAGDAERNRIYAEAYSRDRDFFSFYRSMQAYEAGLRAGDTRLVLNPNSDFFRFFNDSRGRIRTPVGAPPAQ